MKLRFSLRGALILITLLCIGLGVFVSRVRSRIRATEYLTAMGCQVGYHDIPEWTNRLPESWRELWKTDWLKSVELVSIYDAMPKDQRQTAIDELSKLRGVNSIWIFDEDLRGIDLSSLAKLKKLETLDLSECLVRDEELVAVSSFRSLQELGLHRTLITGESVFTKKRFPKLQRLILGSSMLTNEGLNAICRIDTLDLIHIMDTNVDDQVGYSLGSLNLLTDFIASDTNLGDQAAEALATLPELTNLDLDNSLISDVGIAKLGSAKSLLTLDLSDCSRITGHTLSELASAPQLGSLQLSGCPIDLSTLGQLSTAANLYRVVVSRDEPVFEAILAWPRQVEFQNTIGLGVADGSQALDAELRRRINEDDWVNPGLTSLDLEGIQNIPAKYAERMGRARTVSRLWLPDAGIGDEAFAFLARLDYLKDINISGTDVSTVGLREVRNKGNIKTLRALDSILDDEVFELLNQFPKLETVELSGERFAGLRLSDWKLPALIKELYLRAIPLELSQIDCLEALPNLESLSLTAPLDYDRAIQLLKASPKLQWLHWLDSRSSNVLLIDKEYFGVDGEDISSDQLTELLALRPRLTIDIDHLQDSHLESLLLTPMVERLDLDDCLLTPEAISKLAELPLLHYVKVSDDVDIEQARSTLRSWCDLADSVKKQRRRENAAIGSMSQSELSVSLEYNVPTKELMLDFLDFGSEQMTITLGSISLPWRNRSEVVGELESRFARTDHWVGMCQWAVTEEDLSILVDNPYMGDFDWYGDSVKTPPLQIASCDHLQSIDIENAYIDAEWINAIGRIPRLTGLKLTKCRLSDDCLQAIASLRRLTDLELSHCEISDEDLQVLAEIPRLRALNLVENNLTDACVPTLATFPKLKAKYIQISGNDLSPEAMQRIESLYRFSQ